MNFWMSSTYEYRGLAGMNTKEIGSGRLEHESWKGMIRSSGGDDGDIQSDLRVEINSDIP